MKRIAILVLLVIVAVCSMAVSASAARGFDGGMVYYGKAQKVKK